MNNKIMAEKLRKLRGNKSRQEVAEACGISVSALAMYEAGERVPRDEIKIKLAKFYNRSVNYIFHTRTQSKRPFSASRSIRWNSSRPTTLLPETCRSAYISMMSMPCSSAYCWQSATWPSMDCSVWRGPGEYLA